MAAKTNTGLVAYAKAQLGKPYWYGTFGQEGTAALLTSKARQYPSMYTAARLANCRRQYGVKVHDCVGLIKGYLWCDSPEDETPKYNAAQDKSANGMYNACKERGKIATMPDIIGLLVFMEGHVGVYIGGGYVIEARGFSSGVVKTKLAGRGWTKWGKCPYITYTSAAASNSADKSTTATSSTAKKTIAEVAKDVLAGKYGNDPERSKKLKAEGYNPDEVQAEVNKQLAAAKQSAAAEEPKKEPAKGMKVKITGKYASSSTAKTAGNSKAIGTTAYIVKVYEGKAFPYQLGAKKGDASSENTIGFAKASAFKLV